MKRELTIISKDDKVLQNIIYRIPDEESMFWQHLKLMVQELVEEEMIIVEMREE